MVDRWIERIINTKLFLLNVWAAAGRSAWKMSDEGEIINEMNNCHGESSLMPVESF